MLFAFLVTLREGFEIALVVAIVLGYLARTGNRARFRQVWLGTGLAVGVTVALGAVLQFTTAELSGQAREAFEGGAMLAAVGVLTWMVFWMGRQAQTLGDHLRQGIDLAVQRGSLWALVGLAFTAVVREGIETSLFLFAGANTAHAGSDLPFALGGLIGFAGAGVLGYFVYRGSHAIPLRHFFRLTGFAVLVLAAGLLATGIGELQASGVVGNLGSRPWDTDATLSLTTTLGKFLHTLLGYDSAPTWGQIVLYWTYLAAALVAFVWLSARRSPPRRRSLATEIMLPETGGSASAGG